jgi:hypothetical protein
MAKPKLLFLEIGINEFDDKEVGCVCVFSSLLHNCTSLSGGNDVTLSIAVFVSFVVLSHFRLRTLKHSITLLKNF